MNSQVGLNFRLHNPDVLTCIANLSNDEVFTPPDLANRMLDTLAEAWAANHHGASIWADKTVTFLDPCVKSGIFLREITNRLTKGLEKEIPDLQKRVDHILTKQVFGIGITRITSLLARRSVYCSRRANGQHSIVKSFDHDDGNIWFRRIEHMWEQGSCRFCGAPQAIFDRDENLENHAYEFIHTDDIDSRLREIFGGTMQFDVIIGNPPYQMTGGGGGFDSSIYHLFIEQALRLEPRFLSMVIPARWMAGGHGMDEFRATMLASGKLKELFDYPVAKQVFPGVEIKAGVCFFLWDNSHKGCANVTSVRGEKVVGPVTRDLSEFDVFVREHQAVDILKKVLARKAPAVSEGLTGVEPFKWASNFSDYREKPKQGDIPFYYAQRGKRGIGWVSRNQVEKNQHLVDQWKVFMPKAYGAGETSPHQILGKPIIGPLPSVCSGSFIFYNVASESEAQSLRSYYMTKFFRFLVSLRKITQDAVRGTYAWVPQQSWDRTWTDKVLYKQYGLTQDEIDYVESVIKPMSLDVADE